MASIHRNEAKLQPNDVLDKRRPKIHSLDRVGCTIGIAARNLDSNDLATGFEYRLMGVALERIRIDNDFNFVLCDAPIHAPAIAISL